MPQARSRRLVVIFLALVLLVAVPAFFAPWYGWGKSAGETITLEIPPGTAQSAIGTRLQSAGLIDAPRHFTLLARLLGSGETIKAGRYALRKNDAWKNWLAIIQSGKVIRLMLTIPEGMPSALVAERLLANPDLTGPLKVPPEGSLLPETYDYQKGEARAAVVARMQAAMDKTLASLWPARSSQTAVTTPEAAIILASIVEKESGKASERATIAGVYSNRLRIGMKLDADPTVIYPITQGRPLGRRIRRSELDADTGYNTYLKPGLPIGAIANPGRASLEAVLNPAQTDALFFVADGSGGHVFAATLAEHNANVAKWYALRRQRGEM
jgi:UPF0755 protein